MKLILLLIVVSFCVIGTAEVRSSDTASDKRISVIYYPDVSDLLGPRDINIA